MKSKRWTRKIRDALDRFKLLICGKVEQEIRDEARYEAFGEVTAMLNELADDHGANIYQVRSLNRAAEIVGGMK